MPMPGTTIDTGGTITVHDMSRNITTTMHRRGSKGAIGIIG